jgi:glycosyltransferase involved in cell wall biosynthesis
MVNDNSGLQGVLHVIASVNEGIGGPALSVTRICDHLERLGCRSALASLDYRRHGRQAESGNAIFISPVAGFLAQWFRGFQPSFRDALRQAVGNDELSLVHNHGLWMFPNVYARREANRRGLPLVISPRGMLSAWALQRSRLQKHIFRLLYEEKNLQSCRMFHATSQLEADEIRQQGFTQPIAVIQNGVDLPDQMQIPSRRVLDSVWPECAGKRCVLFLSRIHPKKGIEDLIEAWAAIHSDFPVWHLIVAGDSHDNFQDKMKSLAMLRGVASSCTFTGSLSGVRKSVVLAHSDLYVLPTYSENFGISIAESLAHSTPVLTTTNCPWEQLAEKGCGFQCETGKDALVDSLRGMLSISSDQLSTMGKLGRRWMEEDFTWSQRASEMLSSYRWLLGLEPQPSWII